MTTQAPLLKIKHSKLYQFNYGEYQKLERQKTIFLKDSSNLNYFETITTLDLASQNADKLPPLNTLQYYFTNLRELNLSSNRISNLDTDAFVKACPKIIKLDISNNQIAPIQQILLLNKLEQLNDLNIAGNPIDIIGKRICLLRCIVLDEHEPQMNEKLVVEYLQQNYSHVPRMRPQTAVLPQKKRVFPNCTDEYNYQREVLTYVSIEDKNVQGILMMTSLTPRSGGNFRYLRVLNNDNITVRELEEILYYVKFKQDYDNQRNLYLMEQQQAQYEYQKSTLKKGSESINRDKLLKPKNSKRKPKERQTNKRIVIQNIEEIRPDTIQRFLFQGGGEQDGRFQEQNSNFKKREIDSLEFIGEKKRIKEERLQNKKDYIKIRDKIISMKQENEIPEFRFKKITKAPTFKPEEVKMHTIQIKAKNISQALMDDIFVKKEVQKYQTKGKIKVMRRIKQERLQRAKNQDILNQSFESSDMNERKEQDLIKLKDSSSDEDIDESPDSRDDDQKSLTEILSTEENQSKAPESIQHSPENNNNYHHHQFMSRNMTQPLTTQINSPAYNNKTDQQLLMRTLSPSSDQLQLSKAKTMMSNCFSENNFKTDFEIKKDYYINKKVNQQNHITNQKNNFKLMIGRAHREVYKKKDYEEAQKILRRDLFKGHMKYEDLKSSNLKMEYIQLVKDRELFKESLDYFDKHKEFLETNEFYREFFQNRSNGTNGKNDAEELERYEDLVLLYLNCKQNEHRKQDIKKLRQVVNKICPTDAESHFKHKKRNVIEKLDKDLTKISEQEFQRLQTLLNLYSKLDSFPPSIKNFDKWLEINREHQQRAYEKEEQFRKHVESLPQTKIKQAKQQKQTQENKRQQVSLMNTIKLENNYFLSPSNHVLQKSPQEVLNLKSKSEANLMRPMTAVTTVSTAASTTNHQRQESNKFKNRIMSPDLKKLKKLSSITKVEFIEKQMNQPKINSKRMEDDWEPLDMKGSILEYIPQYNHFWNDLKQKVFPLGPLEQIIKDPYKYNHTKEILDVELRKQQKAEILQKKMKKKMSAKLLDEYDKLQSKVIGSKYRFVQYPDQLIEKKKVPNNGDDRSVDISLYLDDICETSTIMEKKMNGKTSADMYVLSEKKEKINRLLEKEAILTPKVHSYNMLGRIVKYAHKKYDQID